jgi:hypothetical protein
MLDASLSADCACALPLPLHCHTGATNSRSDRIAQALSASGDAIAASVSSGNVRGAATKSRDFALLATKENTKASDFGRRLQQGRCCKTYLLGFVSSENPQLQSACHSSETQDGCKLSHVC